MGQVVQWLLTFVLLYKYAAIFVIAFLSALILPLPAGSVLIASAFFALQGYFNLSAVIVAGFIGNVAGDNVGYWLARNYGKPILVKLKLGNFLKSHGFKVLEGKINQHPISTVFFSRFVNNLDPLVNLMAGLAKMPYRSFLATDVVGEIIDVGSLCLCGVLFDSNWEYLQRVLGRFSWIALILVVLVIMLAWSHLRRPAKKSKLSIDKYSSTL